MSAKTAWICCSSTWIFKLIALRLYLLLGLLLVRALTAVGQCTQPIVELHEVKLQGNDKTKDFVLLRELTFQPGDSVATASLDSLLEDNRKRIYNLRLFHYVNYSYTCDNGQVRILYRVQERFYLYPIPILYFADRNFNAWLEKKDFNRIDYGISVTQKNFRGHNEEVRLRLQHGFNRRLELAYRMPYLGGSRNLGAEVSIANYRSHTISYNVTGNRQLFYVEEESMPIQRTAFAAALIHRRNVQQQAALRISYQTEKVSDKVSELNPDYFKGPNERQYFRIDLTKAVNKRNTFAYPLSGSYFEAGIGQTFFLNKSGSDYTTARVKYVHYARISDKYYYTVGAEILTRLADNYAFTDNVALGYRALVRGYELYVVGGQHYGLFKQGLSRELVNVEGIHLKFIKNPKLNMLPLALYLNAFTDSGYTIDRYFEKGNSLTNRLLLGGGIGLHIVTFYDIVLRTEYTVNRESDRGLYFAIGFPF
jgi:outer membrane protein assembly factor BamA